MKKQGEGREADGLRAPGLQELRPAREDRQGRARTRCSRSSGVTDPLLDIAKALEERALADDYFIERKLYPNVDFYTGVIYRAMGFPTKMFTVLFALGRLPGWIAHWREMIATRRTGSAARASSTSAPPSGVPPGAAALTAWDGIVRDPHLLISGQSRATGTSGPRSLTSSQDKAGPSLRPPFAGKPVVCR